MTPALREEAAGTCPECKGDGRCRRRHEPSIDCDERCMTCGGSGIDYLAPAALSFSDALRIARGCTDYGGGYRYDPPKYEAYQHGIQTVINALTAAGERGLSDTQVAALYAMGAEPEAALARDTEPGRA